MIDVAATVTDDPIAPDQYTYIATHAWWLGSFATRWWRFAYLDENVIQQWVPADNDRDWMIDRRVTGRRRWLLGSEEQARARGFDTTDPRPSGRWRAPFGDYDAAVRGRAPAPLAGNWQHPTTEFCAGIPRDPRQLHERLRADSPSRPGYVGAFVYAADALRSGLVPTDVRAALYRALLLIPGVTVDDNAENLHGEPAVALVLDDGRNRTELLVDPANGRFIGERDTVSRADVRGLRPGTVTAFTAVRTATVDAIGEPPSR